MYVCINVNMYVNMYIFYSNYFQPRLIGEIIANLPAAANFSPH